MPRMVLGEAYAQKGSYQQAIPELQKAAGISHDSLLCWEPRHAYAVAGKATTREKFLLN